MSNENIVNLRSVVSALLAGGNVEDDGARVDVETQLTPDPARQTNAEAVTWDHATKTGRHAPAPQSFSEAARAALPAIFPALFGTRPETIDEQHANQYTDRVAMFQLADGTVALVARVKP